MVVAQRNPVYSALRADRDALLALRHLRLLGSPFIAVLQVVVYAGAIMVLFLFVIMLLNVQARGRDRGGERRAALARRWRWPRLLALAGGRGAAARPMRAGRGRRASTAVDAREVARAAVLAALPVRVRGHLGAAPGRAGGRRRAARKRDLLSGPLPCRRTPLLPEPGALFAHRRAGRAPAPQRDHIFMCIELMLNAANLAFVAFSRSLGTLDGQVLRVLRHDRGGGRGRGRPGDRDRPLPPAATRRRGRLQPAEVVSAMPTGMHELLEDAAARSRAPFWPLLVFPLVGFIVLALFGDAMQREGKVGLGRLMACGMALACVRASRLRARPPR